MREGGGGSASLFYGAGDGVRKEVSHHIGKSVIEIKVASRNTDESGLHPRPLASGLVNTAPFKLLNPQWQ